MDPSDLETQAVSDSQLQAGVPVLCALVLPLLLPQQAAASMLAKASSREAHVFSVPLTLMLPSCLGRSQGHLVHDSPDERLLCRYG